MNYTEKLLEELERIAVEHFDYWTEYKGKKTKVINLDAREAVKGLIAQAVAEERERMVGKIEKIIDENDDGLWGCRESFDNLLASLKDPTTL